MSSNVGNVYAAGPLATGVCFVAPLGTPAPTSATSPLNAAFTDLGLVGSEGFTERSDRKIDYKRSFGGRVIKTLQSEFNSSIEFTLVESVNADVLKAIYGEDNVTVTDATSQHGTQVQVNKNAKKLPHQSWVIDTWDDETNAKYRNYIADGKIVTVGEIRIVSTDTIEYRVTVDAYEYLGNDNIITFTDDGVLGS